MITDKDFWDWHLESMVSGWSDCDRCDLACDRDQVVLGRGDTEAPLFVVTESPDETESETGRVMSGTSGRTFRALAKHPDVDLDLRRAAFLTNQVACRPPRGRKPHKDEREKCLERLRSEFVSVKPTVLLLMGTGPLRLCEGAERDAKLGRWRGKVPREHWPWDLISGWGSVNLKLVYVTYDPGYPAKQPTKQKKRIALRKLKDDLGKISPIVKLIMSRRKR